MTKITFTSTEQPDSTHRISDGTESNYFAWPEGVNASKIVAAYARGYDFGDSDEVDEITIYDLGDNRVVFEAEL